MSFFISLGIIFLAMLIQVFLQLSPSIFTIFYHYASGKKSRRVADDFTIFYMIGLEIFAAIIFMLVYAAFFNLFISENNISTTIFPWIMAGIMIALSIVSFFFYFKKSRDTKLFLSRKVASKLLATSKGIKNRSDAFMLGLAAGTFELIFTLPLYIIVTVAVMEIDSFPRQILGFLYCLITTLPTIIYFVAFHSGYNLADIERSRIKNKTFFRTIIALCYLALAFLIMNMGV